jgi:hypothetical protein
LVKHGKIAAKRRQAAQGSKSRGVHLRFKSLTVISLFLTLRENLASKCKGRLQAGIVVDGTLPGESPPLRKPRDTAFLTQNS